MIGLEYLRFNSDRGRKDKMKYQEAIDYIQSLNSYGIVPGLDSIRELCARMGNPQDSLKFIHIAGTNGKGSVLAYISTILKKAGYKVGRYISPTIFHYNERIQIGERPITKANVCEGVELIQGICNQMLTEGLKHPTPFEVETALAFWYFHKMQCDIVVLEAGMGGKEDATNLITTTEAAVLTSIGMDHMQFLGKTLTAVTNQKAGIIKKECSVVSLIQEPEALKVIEDTATQMQAHLTIVEADRAKKVRYGIEKQRFNYDGYEDLEITLAGKHQITNAILAIETVKLLNSGFPVTESALRKGLRETKWKGRFSVIGKKPLFIVDGAHNEDAAAKLAESIEYYFTNKRIIYIMGILNDKDYEKIIELTQSYAEHIITITPPDNPRAMQAYELAQKIAKVHSRVTAVDSLEEAVEMSYLLAEKDDVILAFGSLSYLGKLISIVENKKERQRKQKW